MGEAFLFGNGGGSSGYSVTVRNCGANATVTARHGATQETAIADASGTVVYEKLNKGVWLFTSPSRKNAVAEILGKTDLDFDAEVFNPSPNGLIICTAPVGSTVTAINGTTTFKADKTLMGENEIHVISVKPEHFSDTPISVTCIKTDGTSDTQTAVIDSKQDAELFFAKRYLVKNGVEMCAFELTANKVASNYTARKPDVTHNEGSLTISQPNGNNSGQYLTEDFIDLSRYSKICINILSISASVNSGYCRIEAFDNTVTGSYAQRNLTPVGLLELDITNINDRSRIGFFVFVWSNTASFTFDNLWLE